MCQGFGVIVSNELNCYFSEPDKDGDCSHSTILERLGWQENTSKFARPFVRVQYPDWTPVTFEFDEDSTLPGWAEEHRPEIIEHCNTLLERCATAYAEYEKVRDTAYAEYQKVRDTAYAEYEKVRDTAYAEYEKVRDTAYAELIKQFSAIPGFVPEKE